MTSYVKLYRSYIDQFILWIDNNNKCYTITEIMNAVSLIYSGNTKAFDLVVK